ncbi:cytochrome P450 [Trichoderma sp. SZMC 28014]
MDSPPAEAIKVNWPWALMYLIGPGLLLVGVYRYFTDPLKSVPGPFIAKLTGAWMLYIDLSGQRSNTVHNLHKKHGPAVRVGPSEVCFASPAALKEIYGAHSKYPKAPVYDSLGFKSTFTTRNRDEYRVMKKRIIPSFSPAAVAEIEATVHQQLGLLVKCFDTRLNETLDVLPWFRMLALGVVGQSFVNDSFGGLEKEELPDLLNHIDEVFPVLWTKWMFPTTTNILQYVPIKSIQKFLNSASRFKKYCGRAYETYLASHDPAEHHDLIARMVTEKRSLQRNSENIPRHLTDTGIIEELTNLLFAGTDTTSNTLAYLFWELSHQPKWQVRLREEIRQAIGLQRESFLYSEISDLPVLDAVISEILRLRPAGPAGLLRLAPEGGAVIDGVAVPAYTTISCQALTSQREPTIFPEPDNFNPQRWIDGKKQGTVDQMRDQLLVFGKGSRACLGRRIAIMELKSALAVLTNTYNFEIGSVTTDDDMKMTDHFVLIPKGGRCLLRLTKA